MDTVVEVINAAKTRVPSVVVSILYSVSSLKMLFKAKLLQELDDHCTDLCTKTTPSILRKNQYPDMVNFDWNNVLNEISHRCPLLLEVMCTVVDSTTKPNVVPAIGLCYSILMQKRNHDLSLVQRINTILLSEGHAKKQVGFKEKLFSLKVYMTRNFFLRFSRV